MKFERQAVEDNLQTWHISCDFSIGNEIIKMGKVLFNEIKFVKIKPSHIRMDQHWSCAQRALLLQFHRRLESSTPRLGPFDMSCRRVLWCRLRQHWHWEGVHGEARVVYDVRGRAGFVCDEKGASMLHE